jgi:type II secretory pathway component PulC
LLCVGGVEGGYVALEYYLLKSSVDKVIVADQSIVTEPQKPETTIQKHDYKIILKRNLFGPPPVVKKIEAVVKDPAQDLETTSLKIALKGTIDGEGDSKRAIILDKTNRKQELFQKGDGIQGAFVKQILRGKVILSYNGKDEVLEMSDTAGEAEPQRAVAVTPGRVPKRLTPGAGPPAVKKPTRRIVKPRIIRPAVQNANQLEQQNKG